MLCVLAITRNATDIDRANSSKLTRNWAKKYQISGTFLSRVLGPSKLNEKLKVNFYYSFLGFISMENDESNLFIDSSVQVIHSAKKIIRNRKYSRVLCERQIKVTIHFLTFHNLWSTNSYILILMGANTGSFGCG